MLLNSNTDYDFYYLLLFYKNLFLIILKTTTNKKSFKTLQHVYNFHHQSQNFYDNLLVNLSDHTSSGGKSLRKVNFEVNIDYRGHLKGAIII